MCFTWQFRISNNISVTNWEPTVNMLLLSTDMRSCMQQHVYKIHQTADRQPIGKNNYMQTLKKLDADCNQRIPVTSKVQKCTIKHTVCCIGLLDDGLLAAPIQLVLSGCGVDCRLA